MEAGPDRVIDWEPDGQRIRFQSARESRTGRDLQLYTVADTGGLPRKMILPTAGLSSYAPDGKRIAFLAKQPKSEEREKAEADAEDTARRLRVRLDFGDS